MHLKFDKSGAIITGRTSDETERWTWNEIERISMTAKAGYQVFIRYLAIEHSNGDFVEISSDNPRFQCALRELANAGAMEEDQIMGIASTSLPTEGRIMIYQKAEIPG